MKLETDNQDLSTASLVSTPSSAATPEAGQVPSRRQFTKLAIFAAILLVVYALPLLKLAVFALHSDLYSHVLLIPFVSAYLLWIRRTELQVTSRPSPGTAALTAIFAVLVVALYWLAARNGWISKEKPEDAFLSAMTLSLLLFLLAGAFIFLGAKYLRNISFAVALLIFSVPYPSALRH